MFWYSYFPSKFCLKSTIPIPVSIYLTLTFRSTRFRSAGSHSVILYLQHSPSLLTRAQLTSFLDSFLGPASPQLHGGHWQFLDHAGVWCDLASLPEGTPATNRFPIQIFFDSEEQAGPTLQALRQVGFLQLETSLEQLQQ